MFSRGEKVTYFAQTNFRNKKTPFGIKAKDRTHHMYVVGKTGMGKSTLLEHMAVQDIGSGEGFAFIDPNGKTADLLIEHIPKHRIKDVVYFDPFDVENPMAFNIMEDVSYERRHVVLKGLIGAFKKTWADVWSPRIEYILSNTILALLEYPGATLLGVDRMYTDEDYRKKVVENIKDQSVKSFWVGEYVKYSDEYIQEAIPAIQDKMDQLTSDLIIKNIIGQPKSTFDFRDIMDKKKIFIVNLSKGRIGESSADLLGSMIITKIYLARMLYADLPYHKVQKLPNFYLYVNEFQSCANESFIDILAEAKKYKLNLIIAHQYIEQVPEEVRAAVFGNVGTKIMFRIDALDADLFEKEFSPVFFAEDMVNLDFTQIYLRLMIDGVTSHPFSATTLPPIPRKEKSFTEEVLKNSRNIYTRSRLEAEDIIDDWYKPTETLYTQGAPKDETKSYTDISPRVQRKWPKKAEVFSEQKNADNDFIEDVEHVQTNSTETVDHHENKKNAEKYENNLQETKAVDTATQNISVNTLRKRPSINGIVPKKDKGPSEKNLEKLRNALGGMVKEKEETSEQKKDESAEEESSTKTQAPEKSESYTPEDRSKDSKPAEIPEHVLKKILGVDK